MKVSGLAPTVAIFHTEAANDRLDVNTLAGNDTVASDGLAAGTIQLRERRPAPVGACGEPGLNVAVATQEHETAGLAWPAVSPDPEMVHDVAGSER